MKKLATGKKIMALLLTLFMVFGAAVPAFTANGPSPDASDSAALVLHYGKANNSDEYYQYTLYKSGEEADTVEGAAYDQSTNTVTFTNYNQPDMVLFATEMGDDLKLRLVGDNHIAGLMVTSYGWGGNLEIIGDGSLTINEDKTYRRSAIHFFAGGTEGALKVGPEVTLTAYASSGEDEYAAEFIMTNSPVIPFTANLETKLTMTPRSGLEAQELHTVFMSTESDGDYELTPVTKGDDGKKYGLYYTFKISGSETVPVAVVFEMVKVDGLLSGNEYVGVRLEQIDGISNGAIPEGYTKEPDATTVTVKQAMVRDMAVLDSEDGETFYWGPDGVNESGSTAFSVYRSTGIEMRVTNSYGSTYDTKLAIPVEGMRKTSSSYYSLPDGYNFIFNMLGQYDYECTNDVIKVVPVTSGGGDEVKNLASSDTSVSISLTDGVPKGSTLYADTMALQSVFETRPGLEKELAGLLSVYQIAVRKNGEIIDVKDNPMTVKIPLNNHLRGYEYYQAVYLGQELERFDAKVEGDYLTFQTDHLSQYAILGSNTPFAGGENPPAAVETVEQINLENVAIHEVVKIGKAPVFTAAVADADKDKYEIYMEQWTGDDGKSIASLKSFNDTIPEDKRITVFEEGVTYKYSVWLKAKEGYNISKSASLYYDGARLWSYEFADHAQGESPEGTYVSGEYKDRWGTKCVLANLEVNGEQVTTANMKDILGDADGAGATVYYKPETNTLTLDNAKLTVTDEFSGILSRDMDFVIELKGKNQIIGNGKAENAIYTHCNLTIKGSGSLTTTGTGYGIYGNAPITVEGGASVDISVAFSSDGAPQPLSGVRAIGGLTVDGATFKARNEGTAGEYFGAPGISTSLTAKNGAKVDISSVNSEGILEDVMVSGKDTVVKVTSESSEYCAVFAGNKALFEPDGVDREGTFTVSDGATVILTGGKGASRWKPDLTGYTNPYITAGSDAQSAAEVTDPANTDYHTNKYVSIVAAGQEGPEIKKGDVNGDGKVDLLDLRLLLRYICGKAELNERELKAANMVGDEEKVDLLDLRMLLRVICGKA